jgi:hypothetical protein
MFPKIGIPKVTMAFLEKNWGLPHLLGSRQVNNHHMHEEKQGDRLFEALFFALFQDVPKSKMGIFHCYVGLPDGISRKCGSKMEDPENLEKNVRVMFRFLGSCSPYFGDGEIVPGLAKIPRN